MFGIIERPGKLCEVSAAASTISEVRRPQPRKKARASKHPPPINWTPRHESLENWKTRQKDLQLQNRIKQRKTLPAWEMRDSIVDTVKNHQVTIISEKQDQVNQPSLLSSSLMIYTLERWARQKIICTQPRRICAQVSQIA